MTIQRKEPITYRLIDKLGYMGSHPDNRGIYEKYFVNNCVTITDVSCEDGSEWVGSTCIIFPEEFKYFEEVVVTATTKTFTLDDLEAGKHIVVVDSTGDTGLYLGDKIIYNSSWEKSENVMEKIAEVYELKEGLCYGFRELFHKLRYKEVSTLIWERQKEEPVATFEKREYTKSELTKILEEM